MEATGRTALRTGSWKMIPPYPGPAVLGNVNIELGNNQEYQLYHLAEDLEERDNLATREGDTLQVLLTTYAGIRGLEQEPVEEIELK